MPAFSCSKLPPGIKVAPYTDKTCAPPLERPACVVLTGKPKKAGTYVFRTTAPSENGQNTSNFIYTLAENDITKFRLPNPIELDLRLAKDFRFYRGAPPLQATPLPARLSPLSPNPIGDYHAIRVP